MESWKAEGQDEGVQVRSSRGCEPKVSQLDDDKKRRVLSESNVSSERLSTSHQLRVDGQPGHSLETQVIRETKELKFFLR